MTSMGTKSIESLRVRGTEQLPLSVVTSSSVHGGFRMKPLLTRHY